MPYDHYPDQNDLLKFIQGFGLQPSPSLDLKMTVESAAEDWESRTGWFPFLANKGEEQIVLDNDQRGWGWGSGFGAYGGFGTWRMREPILDLECGVLSISSIVIGWPNQAPVQILEEGRDFILGDRNAQRKKWPFTWIELKTSWCSVGFQAMDIIVNARCGFCSELPANVYRAILCKSFSDVAPQLTINQTGGMSAWSQNDTKENYAEGSASIMSQAQKLKAEYNSTLLYYHRMTI